MADVAQLPINQRAALAYAEKWGWYVFPLHNINDKGNCSCEKGPQCGSPGKHPRTSQGFKNATIDTNQIKAWWKRYPEANIGIATGLSGLVIVDIDPRNGGDESMRELEKIHGKLPNTTRSLTGGGGEHSVFLIPEEISVLKGTPIARGVDIKAHGGYIVAPPSNHISGRKYEWDAGAHPTEQLPLPLPKWILSRLEKKQDNKQYESGGTILDGFLGVAFEAEGWLGRSVGPGKAAAYCPWEDEHSCGTRFDSSTVIFSPTKGKRLGWWFCSHEHCKHRRTVKDVLAQLSDSSKRIAREKLGLDPQYVPEADAEQTSPNFSETNEEWIKALRFNDKGSLTRDTGNAALILANLEGWSGCLEYDAFADRILWSRPPPTMPGIAAPDPGSELSDHHVTYVHHWLARYRSVSFAKQSIQDALEAAAKQNTRHPVKDYFHSLQWDRKPRLHAWLRDYLGAPDDPYVYATGRWWMVSAVARIMNPGCQADHLLVLEGDQGSGKSTAVRILAGTWYLPNLPDIASKDAAQLLQGSWIVEIGELDVFKGANSSRVKDWVTRTVDRYRPAYGRFTVGRPRQCVFLGTTNEQHYLTDSTGARRFWPVACTGLAREELIRDRDQLWAEAVKCYDAGEDWHPSIEWKHRLSEAQEERYEGDVWEPLVVDWLLAQRDNGREYVTTTELMKTALSMDPSKMGRREQMRVGAILRRIGMERRRIRSEQGLLWGFYYTESFQQTVVGNMSRNGINEYNQ